MASATARRRCLGPLARHCRSLLQSSNTFFEISRPASFSVPPSLDPLTNRHLLRCVHPLRPGPSRHFASQSRDQPSEEEEEWEEEEGEEDDEDDEEEGEDEEGESNDDEECDGSRRVAHRSGKTEEEKVEDAAEIGYKVVGPLGAAENPFKPYEPVFAVVQVGSHQFKVSNGDAIFVERLKFCDVNEKIILSKVLMLGSKAQTIVGRPMLPDAAVHAVVEEHALDAKKIIFKKKRRKNYRRTKGHRQELTKLRITDIQGIEKLESVALAA